MAESKEISKAEPKKVPTLFEWAGGEERLRALFIQFYEAVKSDALLAPVFAKMSAHHAVTVSKFVGEVLGGPPLYSGDAVHGHSTMIAKHLDRHLTDEQRKRWMGLLLETADHVGLPADPEFRSALVGYLEWGSRIAVLNSNASVNPVDSTAPMPQWGWGEVKGPYQPG